MAEEKVIEDEPIEDTVEQPEGEVKKPPAKKPAAKKPAAKKSASKKPAAKKPAAKKPAAKKPPTKVYAVRVNAEIAKLNGGFGTRRRSGVVFSRAWTLIDVLTAEIKADSYLEFRLATEAEVESGPILSMKAERTQQA